MKEIRLGVVETRFADILWENVPLQTKELIKICEKELNWKRTTTYTVLKKMCDREIFKVENRLITALVTKEEFYAIQSEKYVENVYEGSLPAFIAAFTSRQKLSDEDLSKIMSMIDDARKEQK
ncbi:MAG: BlaI/MecI/CopY family transcriptional regulator [Ruminococcaceae bacterium]|nr:BlaI/MecI/CopY family transcriptional regulator [Oscillospiraceae bacterium]